MVHFHLSQALETTRQESLGPLERYLLRSRAHGFRNRSSEAMNFSGGNMRNLARTFCPDLCFCFLLFFRTPSVLFLVFFVGGSKNLNTIRQLNKLPQTMPLVAISATFTTVGKLEVGRLFAVYGFTTHLISKSKLCNVAQSQQALCSVCSSGGGEILENIQIQQGAPRTAAAT